MKTLLLILTLTLVSQGAWARGLSKSLNSLGADPAIIKRARAMDPKNRVRVVQKRSVDRNLRFEFGMNYSMISGGNPFLNSAALGGLAEFHVTPRFSLGARYSSFDNSLNSEAKARYEAAALNPQAKDSIIPEIDSPLNSTHAVLSWYPVYGKMNLFDMGISQFDIYLIGGVGQVNLKSGSSDSLTFGGGLGLWLNKYMSSRFEVRNQTFQDQVSSGKRDLNMTSISFSLGVLL